MNIRSRLTLRFIISVAIIMVMALMLIYIFSAGYREEDFYNRLHSKANNTAKLLIDVDEVDINLLRKIEHDNPVSLPNEKIIVYDFHNEIIFSTDEQSVIHISQDLLDRIRLEEEVRYWQDDYEVLGFLFKGRYDRFAVVAAATDIHGFSRLNNLRAILLVVFAITIVAVSVSGWFFAGKALQPISTVVHQVDEITISSLNLRVNEGNGQDEIAQLARTFNNMLQRLEASFIVQKNFIANASHELRTPLTAITGQLEVSLLHARTNDEYRGVVNSVLDDIKNLNNLANRLLLLAQTSADGTDRSMTHLRIDELLWLTREELMKRDPGYSINIDLASDLDDESRLTINGDEQLMKVALLNLIENGCKYSPDHRIEVLVRATPSHLVLQFRDQGIGIPEADRTNIFEPFYRGENTQGIKGYGIGLSVVQRIVILHKGTITLVANPEGGTTFTVTLPF
ncbi:HAMP domain-containing histidine kinase [Fulvivirgaceae bacterium PWU5]|uniref:histidine kinase n=1 Tax=Dawidia cretensis TaxID=2782350 RepID=A0AAP2E2F4_9BACT|nr:HAMP domain-containing sensor histidine kinase [Dawidia cretensis]MBT1710447.1 HAMP domain-containing histidine kinase [Dawidia cretensis]